MSNTVKATGKQTAQQAEASDEPFVDIEWEGVTYRVPNDPEEVDESIYDALNEKQILIALIGEDQYAKWRGNGRKIRELKAFGEAIAEASGFVSLGN
jgi:hypothetical protein